MELLSLSPFIRFADVLRFTAKRGPSKTYDSRMLYCLSGEALFLMEGEEHVLRYGTFVLFPPGTEYVIRPKKEVTLAVFDFDPTDRYKARTAFLTPCPADRFREEDAHEKVIVSDFQALSAPLCLESASFLEPLIRGILTEYREKRVRFREVASARFKELLSELARSMETAADEKNVVARVMDYVEAHLGERLTNQTIGEALHYNPNYLNRVLSEKTGTTLHRLVMAERLKQAKMLLFTTDRPVNDIAETLGFCSAAHFIAFVRRETGLTPAGLRRTGAV